MPSRLILPLLLGACSAFAQAPTQRAPQPSPAGPDSPLIQEQQAPDGRRDQKIERIRLEDSGSVVDEVRYGGRTQSITVQPKAGVPRYEVEPVTGQRSWNVLNF